MISVSYGRMSTTTSPTSVEVPENYCNVAIPPNPLLIAKDTIEFYLEYPHLRGNKDNTCRYRLDDPEVPVPKRCAIGRYIPNDKYLPKLETFGLSAALDRIPGSREAAHEGFYTRLQNWHDSWDPESGPSLLNLWYLLREIDIISFRFTQQEPVEIFVGVMSHKDAETSLTI